MSDAPATRSSTERKSSWLSRRASWVRKYTSAASKLRGSESRAKKELDERVEDLKTVVFALSATDQEFTEEEEEKYHGTAWDLKLAGDDRLTLELEILLHRVSTHRGWRLSKRTVDQLVLLLDEVVTAQGGSATAAATTTNKDTSTSAGPTA